MQTQAMMQVTLIWCWLMSATLAIVADVGTCRYSSGYHHHHTPHPGDNLPHHSQYLTTQNPYSTDKYHHLSTQNPYPTDKYHHLSTQNPYSTDKYQHLTTQYPYSKDKYQYHHQHLSTQNPYSTDKYQHLTTQNPHYMHQPFVEDGYTHQPSQQIYFEDEGNRFLCLMVGLCATSFHQPAWGHKSPLAPVYQWSHLEFDYKSELDRQRDIDSETFIPKIPAPIDVDVYYAPNDNDNRIFVTIPRFQKGIPVALGIVSGRQYQGNPVITPYPAWSWHRNPTSCRTDRIVSVYRVQIDDCGRMWVLDTGRYLEQNVCPPQILAFDLRTDELIHRYEIPQDQIESRSILVTPVVDIRDPEDGCSDTFVYVADCQTYSIIVYDVNRQTSWRITDKTLYPYPNYGTYTIQGESFELMDGVLGMALSPYEPGQDRRLYYHAMSSPTENWVYTSDLRNQTRFEVHADSSPEIFTTYRGHRDSQSAAAAIDENGIMYFGLHSDVTLNCWNTATEYGPRNIDTIGDNPETLQFLSGVKVIKNKRGEQELWIVSSRFQKVATGSISTSETNFRIQAGKIDDLIFSSKCRPRPAASGAYSTTSRATTGGYGLRPRPSRQQHALRAPGQGPVDTNHLHYHGYA